MSIHVATAQTKLRINPQHLQTCLLRMRFALRRLRTCRCMVIAERSCFYPCFVAVPSQIVHIMSSFLLKVRKRERQGKQKKGWDSDMSIHVATAQTKLRINPQHLQTCLLRMRFALRRLRTCRCMVIAERSCFYPCFVAVPSQIVHIMSSFLLKISFSKLMRIQKFNLLTMGKKWD